LTTQEIEVVLDKNPQLRLFLPDSPSKAEFLPQRWLNNLLLTLRKNPQILKQLETDPKEIFRDPQGSQYLVLKEFVVPLQRAYQSV